MSHHLSKRQLRARALLLVGVVSLFSTTLVARADTLWSTLVPEDAGYVTHVQCDGPTMLDLCFVSRGGHFETLHAIDASLAWGVDFTLPPSGIAIGAPYGSEEIFLGDGDGHLYAFNAIDGAPQWIGDTRRDSCLLADGDGLQAAPAIQEWRLSNADFQSAQPSDLIFVVTAFGCGTTTLNQVIAFDPAGNIKWRFNPVGTEQMDIGSQACVVDYSSNTLYCGTKLQSGAFQNTLWALDTTNGAKRWARNLGSVVTSPVLSGGRLYVATDDGHLSAIDPVTGIDLWVAPVPVAAAGINNIRLTPTVYSRPAQAPLVLVTDTGGYLHAVADQGDHGATAFWSPVNFGVGLDSAAVAIRGTGLAYVHAADGTVHQVDLRNGSDLGIWLPIPFIAGAGVLSVDHSAVGQPADRLLTTGFNLQDDGFVNKSGIPFTIGSNGGPFASDYSASRYAADLELTMAAPVQVTPSMNVDYTITVINHGADWATDVTLTDSFLATAESVSVSQGTVSRESLPQAGFVGVIASFGDLAPNASATLTARVTAPAAGTFTNSASVVSGELDPDPSNNAASVTTTVVPPDTSPPITTAMAIPGPNAAGWNKTTVTITLTANDEPGGSGVKEIHFSLSGAQVGSGVMSGNTTPVMISAEGITRLMYFAVDNAGNAETVNTLTVQIDLTPPVITASRAPAPNASGWNNTSVTVTFSCSDALSGVASCQAPITLTTEGANQSVTGTATDRAGNSATVTVSGINVDLTPPVLTLPGTITVPAAGPTGAMVSYLVSAADNLTPTSMIRVSCTPPSGATFPITTPTMTTTTTVNCTGTDLAGNSATGSFQVVVLGAADQLSSLPATVQSFNLLGGIENSLDAKLAAAQAALAAARANSVGTACNQLGAFINAVQAQSGTMLTVAQASQLIAVATQIKAVLACP